jgi:hypothetical protein
MRHGVLQSGEWRAAAAHAAASQQLTRLSREHWLALGLQANAQPRQWKSWAGLFAVLALCAVLCYPWLPAGGAAWRGAAAVRA